MKKVSTLQIDGAYVLLGIVVAISIVQLWFTVDGMKVLFGNPQPIEQASAASEEAQTTKKESAVGMQPQRIIAPTANVDMEIISVPLEEGTWIVNEHVANYAEGTGLINPDTGNIGLFGHDRSDAFAWIKTLQTGDIIQLKSDNKIAEYAVEESHQVNPDEVSEFYPTDNPMVTLVTCDGNLSEKRFVVKASLIQITEI